MKLSSGSANQVCLMNTITCQLTRNISHSLRSFRFFLTFALLLIATLWIPPATAQTVLNLTTTSTSATWNGARFEQGDGSFSGPFDPFYQISGSNFTAVSGVNTAGRPVQFETVSGGSGAAKDLLLSSVP